MHACRSTLEDPTASNASDCNDANGAVYQLLVGYVDGDGDGYSFGAQLSVCSGAQLPSGYVAIANAIGADCNDGDPSEGICLLRVVNREWLPFPDYNDAHVMEILADGTIVNETAVPLPKIAKEMAMSDDGISYTTNRHYAIHQTDVLGTSVDITPTVPDISWPSGTAFDSLRDRVLVSGRLSFNVFDPSTSQWTQLSVNNFEYDTMAYDEVSDVVFAADDYTRKTTLKVLSPTTGATLQTILYTTPIVFEEQLLYYEISSELVSRGGRLFMYLSSPNSFFSQTPLVVTRALWEIDPQTGDVWQIALD